MTLIRAVASGTGAVLCKSKASTNTIVRATWTRT